MVPINGLPARIFQQLVTLGEVLAAKPAPFVRAQRTWMGRLQHMMLLSIYLGTTHGQALPLLERVHLGSFLLGITSPEHEDNSSAVVRNPLDHLFGKKDKEATNGIPKRRELTASVSCSQPRPLCEFASPLRTVNTFGI